MPEAGDAVLVALGHLIDPWSICLLVAGILLGILPGLGPPIAITIALPFTFYMEPVPSFILLLSIYSAATYGGSISAIALGIPGTGAAIAMVQDGHRMFKAGRGGEALGLSLTASIIGGLFSTVCLTFIAPLLAKIAIQFGPREYFAIGVFGLVVVVRVAGTSMAKGLFIGGVGIFLTTWGIDEINGTERFTFGSYHLYEGMPFVPFLVGVFAVSELLISAEKTIKTARFDKESLKARLPSFETLSRLEGLLLRSSSIGTVIGIIPGEGAAVGAFFSYSEAKRRSPEPAKLGTGIPEGVVAPEAANNATIGGALVPTLFPLSRRRSQDSRDRARRTHHRGAVTAVSQRPDDDTVILFPATTSRGVAEVANRVVVMHDGRIVESGATGDVLHSSQGHGIRILVTAVPSLCPLATNTRASFHAAYPERVGSTDGGAARDFQARAFSERRRDACASEQ